MGNLVLDAVQKLLFNVIQGALSWIGAIAGALGKLGTLQLALPWIQPLKADIMAVTWTILGLYIAYKSVHHYILWNEGTADPDGSVLAKSILRTGIYVALSGTIATMVYEFGLNFAVMLIAAPMASSVKSLHGTVAAISGVSSDIGIVIAGILFAIIAFVALVIMLFQFAVRAAEIVVYVLAAPLVSLGQMNADGGTWSHWWSNLVILSMTPVAQFLALKGFASSAEVMALGHGFGLGGEMARLGITLLLQIGWLVVGIRGAHLLKQWSSSTGVGGGFVGIVGHVGRTAVTNQFTGSQGGSASVPAKTNGS